MVIERSLRNRSIIVPEGPIENHSDSDEAPEEFTYDVAKEQALKTIQREEVARSEVAKKKRKISRTKTTENHESVSDSHDKALDVPLLPEDIVSQLVDPSDNTADTTNIEEISPSPVKKIKKIKKNTHVRTFGNVEVRMSKSIKKSATRELSNDAIAFLAKLNAPNRPRMNILEGHPSQFRKSTKRKAQ